jgi:hypothetical protein
MKRRFADGREVLKFTAETLLLRLVGLIPPPRVHLVRYAGIFASRASGREALTGRSRNDEPAASASASATAEDLERTRVDLPTLCQTPRPNDPGRPRRLDWAQLLRRAFAIDVLVCPRCQGPMCLIGVVEAPAVIRRIMAHLGLHAAPARAGPQLTLRAGRIDTLLETFDGIDPPAPVD